MNPNRQTGSISQNSLGSNERMKAQFLLACCFCLIQIGHGQVADVQVDKSFADLTAWATGAGILDVSTTILRVFPTGTIDPTLTSPDLTTREHAVLILADTVPQPTSVYTPTSRTTYSVYQSILDNRDTSTSVLTDTEKKELRAAERILLRRECIILRIFSRRPRRTQSKRLTKYRTFEAEYTLLETSLAGAPDEAARSAIRKNMELVNAQWEANGNKNQIEAALRTVDEIASTSDPAFWAATLVQFHTNIRNIAGVAIPSTYFKPDASNWVSASGWTDWNVGTSGGQIKVIAIIRPWLKIDALTLRKWTWAEGRMKRERVMISDGRGLEESTNRTALMPVLPVAILLGRPYPVGGNTPMVESPKIIAVICRVLPRQPY